MNMSRCKTNYHIFLVRIKYFEKQGAALSNSILIKWHHPENMNKKRWYYLFSIQCNVMCSFRKFYKYCYLWNTEIWLVLNFFLPLIMSIEILHVSKCIIIMNNHKMHVGWSNPFFSCIFNLLYLYRNGITVQFLVVLLKSP